MTRFFLALCVFPVAFNAAGQQPAKPAASTAIVKSTAAANDIFSGSVTASAPESITVVRKLPAKPDESRVFVVDKDTKIEGKLRVNAHVSVRFKADGEGAVHALRIIVRVDAKTSPAAGKAQPPSATK